MSNMNPWCHGVTIVTRDGVSGRHPLIEILSAWHGHELISIPRAWHARVRPFRSDLRCALFTARVRAVGQEFRRGLPAPGRIPQSLDVGRENRIGRLVRIGCSCPATLRNLMPIFFSLPRSRVRATHVESNCVARNLLRMSS